MSTWGIGLHLGVHVLLDPLFELESDDVGRLFLSARNAPEVFLCQGESLLILEVADQHEGDVLRRVVGGVEFIGLRLADRGNVRGPADDRPAIGVGDPEHGVELFLGAAQGRGLRAHAPLFEDDVALGVELAEDGVELPLAFHPHPKLELVGGDGDEVSGDILGREGVHAGGAGGGVDLVELILHENLALGGDQLLEFLVQLLVALCLILGLEQVVNFAATIRGAHFLLLLAHQIADALLLGDDLLVFFVVGSAQRGRALEHHVLKQVRHAGDAGAFVGAADFGDPAARYSRFALAFEHEDLHAVGERFFDDARLLRLGRCAGDKQRRDEEDWGDGFHELGWLRNSQNVSIRYGYNCLNTGRPSTDKTAF